MTAQERFDAIVKQPLKDEYPCSWAVWIKPLEVVSVTNSTVSLYNPMFDDKHKQNVVTFMAHVKEHYVPRIEALLSVKGKPVKVRLTNKRK